MARTSATHAGIRSIASHKRDRSPSPDLDALFDKELEIMFGNLPQLTDQDFVFIPPRSPSPNLFDSPVVMVSTEKAQHFQPECAFGSTATYGSSQQQMQAPFPQFPQASQASQVAICQPSNFGYAPQEPYYNGLSPFTFYTSGQPLGELPGNLNYQMEPVQTGLVGKSVLATGAIQAPQQESLLNLLNDDAPDDNQDMNGLRVPKYIPKPMLRGAGGGADKFFEPPYMNDQMTKNEDLIGVLAHGSDKQVEALSNLSCACPPVKYKCDASMDSAMFVRTTHTLMTMHGVSNLADVFRHVGMLGDRCCVQCKKPGMGCVAGTFQCINCLNKRGNLSFVDGFDMWLANGQLVRHAEKM
jgi:hypothetical protein